MAAARERNDSSYDDGGGFGKFRKRPFRRVQATPYDRPSTAIRNPSLATNSNNNNGWLSKLVDPAQRLITSSAHKLFASVFRKRLPPPRPPQPPEPVANGEAHDKLQEAVPKDPPGMRGSAVNVIDSPGSSEGGRLAELELILKQKTFTRSEIDQLTALLQSRTVDLTVGNQVKKSEAILSKAALSLDRKEDFLTTPIKDNGLQSHQTSTPIIGSSVLDEDVASPAELAKAYMGTRPSKISPSALGLRTRPVGEDSIAQIDRPFPSKSPIMSVVPRSSGRVVFSENGFVTPRSRGRSAIYSMARTPYSRVHSSSTLQGAGAESNVLGASSVLSPGILGSNRVSGSKQGALKRRSSVLENDIGSVGPIRRIRQKSNLLPSNPLSIRGTGPGSDASQQPSSSWKPVLASEPSMENGDNNIRGSGFTSVPSKSSEMASKILQQLDVLISSREKSPSKLSPSMLRGPALRSLENVDSSKFLETVQDDNKQDASHNALLPDVQETLSQKQDKVEENGLQPIASYEKSASAVNGVNSTNLMKNNASDVKRVALPVMDSVAQPLPQKRGAFQMSAHEDYLDLDDDDHPDRTASAAVTEERERLDATLAGNKIGCAQAITLEKPAGFSLAKPQESSILDQKTPGTSDGSGVVEKSSGFLVPVAPLPGASAQQDVVEKQAAVTSDKTISTNELCSSPSTLNFGEKDVSPKEPNGFPPVSGCITKTAAGQQLTFASTSPVLSDSTGLKFGTSSNPKSESSSSFTFAAVDATKSANREPESDKVGTRNSLKASVFSSSETVSSTLSTSSPAAGILSFGLPTSTSSLNGSIAGSTHSFSSTGPALVSSNIFGGISSSSTASSVVNCSGNATGITTTSANMNSSSSISASASAPSFASASAPFFASASAPSSASASAPSSASASSPSATVFKFGSSGVPPALASSNSTVNGVESTETKTKEMGFGNSVIAPIGSSSSAINSTVSSIFSGVSSGITGTGSSTLYGTSSAAASTENNLGGTSLTTANTGSGIFSFNAGASTSAATNQSQGFNPFSTASSQASVAGTVFATSTQSLPIQSGSSPSFGLTANKAFSSGGSLFSSSSSSSSSFSSGTTFGLFSSSSEANSVSSTTSSLSTTFGSSWPTPKSSIFVPAFTSASSSTGFAFGASSASNTTSSSTSMMFGSTNAFAFNSPAVSTSSQPGFGNSSPAFTFQPSPSGNNDQMNMEDSMAEDTVQATTSTIQPPVAPLSSPFIFGSTGPSGVNQFGSTAPSGANPFQFGSQSVPPQNPSLASGSLEVNGGGSFSLGTGGGGGDKSNRRFVRIRKNPRKK